jgi:predicted alpha/beta-hydrolase family hydrolase
MTPTDSHHNTKLLFDGPGDAAYTIALAHGAGAGMDTPFMTYFAAGLGGRGFRVARFEFPYMASYRQTAKRKPPDKEQVLRDAWLSVIENLGRARLFIGGKSMGGRIASLVADQSTISGLICLGYPFHPVGKPDQLRVQHLRSLQTPALILQGERDPFGSRDEVAQYQMSSKISLHWLVDGDHSFKPRKKSGRTEEQNWQEAIDKIDTFCHSG